MLSSPEPRKGLISSFFRRLGPDARPAPAPAPGKYAAQPRLGRPGVVTKDVAPKPEQNATS